MSEVYTPPQLFVNNYLQSSKLLYSNFDEVLIKY